MKFLKAKWMWLVGGALVFWWLYKRGLALSKPVQPRPENSNVLTVGTSIAPKASFGGLESIASPMRPVEELLEGKIYR